MKKSLTMLLGVAAFAGIIVSCHSGEKDKQASSTRKQAGNLRVSGLIVKPSVLDQTITVSGTLKPSEETVLMPEVSGRVVAINLHEGGIIKQGTVLIKLFDGDLQAQLHKSEAQLKIAEQTQKRQGELIKVNGISQLDYDQSVLQVSSIKADIEVLKVQIRKTELRAPFNGTIGLRNVSIGAQVTPSTALATIREVAQLKLDFSVPEKYSSAIKPGQKIKFSVQGDDKKYEASVMATEQGIDAGSRNLKARAIVKSKASSLIPGAFANVELRLNENKNALMVPTQCIIPQERSKKIIIAQNGKAKFVTVKTGIRNASAIEIVSGIKPGDTVVTSGVLFLKPNAVLKFSKVKRDTL
ncbi:MAG: efflux RND transporter periplasmic adaptor subunit [Bacteroidota bacterium]|nr:efflux RND transporter periplasmic adaptor subunit [Bacteroidota bacterium]